MMILVILASLTAFFIPAEGREVNHFEPQVAILCLSSKGFQTNFHSQYMTEGGVWTTDFNHKPICTKEKTYILDYCKKIYPKRDITNIVESSHFVKVPSWCKIGREKCKHTEYVKPYRCLEGPFQSDALLVPENCLFDHIHNQTKCWEFDKWNKTAAFACQDRGMTLKTFAMLLPCGISLFSGVEFVCCPSKDKINFKKSLTSFGPSEGKHSVESELTEMNSNDNDDDEDDEDDELEESDDEDYEAYDDNSSVPAPTIQISTKTTTLPTPDPYYTKFNPRNEHQAFKEALRRLEEQHREKVTKVMKDWSDLEEKYQDMRNSDSRMAEEFKRKMTLSFQQTVQLLEEEGNAEKHQLVVMHQQRVMAHINKKKKEAMNCFTQALNDNPFNSHKVQKCLQKLLRTLHKDRHHTISHYRHLLSSSVQQAEREKPLTLEHLVDIDHTVNQSIQMLERFPELSSKLSLLMTDYIQALRSKDDTPGSSLSMSREAESAILEKFRADATAMHEASLLSDKEREMMLENERKQAHKRERDELRRMSSQSLIFKGQTSVEELTTESKYVEVTLPTFGPMAQPLRADPQPFLSSISQDTLPNKPTFSVRREVYHHEAKSIFFTLAFAGIALVVAMLLGLSFLRRRTARSPQLQGFAEVNQVSSPEERHVTNMQINGYENPTYKYFEIKDN